jgi:hypothetical protein
MKAMVIPIQSKLSPLKKLRLNRSNGWVVLELAQENHCHVTVWAEDGTVALNNLETDKRTEC